MNEYCIKCGTELLVASGIGPYCPSRLCNRIDDQRALQPGEIIPLAFGQDIRFVPASDTVNHPSHYTAHPSGVECIDVTEHMNFNVGNAVKYLWRADLKNDPIENLRKAIWYIEREIQRRTAATKES